MTGLQFTTMYGCSMETASGSEPLGVFWSQDAGRAVFERESKQYQQKFGLAELAFRCDPLPVLVTRDHAGRMRYFHLSTLEFNPQVLK